MAKGNGNSAGKSVAMMPGKNGGALRRGNPGNAGRPPSKIREIARTSFEKRIPTLEKIADNESAKDSDRIAAIKVLADTGGVDKLALTVDEQPEERMTPERMARIWETIQQIKTIQQLERLLVGKGE